MASALFHNPRRLGRPAIRRQIGLSNSRSRIEAESLDQLGKKLAIPPEDLVETVHRYNHFVTQGDDADFHTFGPTTSPKPHRIQKSPFMLSSSFQSRGRTMAGSLWILHAVC